MNYPEISLRKNSEQMLRRGHPWVYSGAVEHCSPDVAPGEMVDVKDSRDGFVGRGYYNPHSTIAVRVMSRDRNEAIDPAFLTRAVERAHRLRLEDPVLAQTDAYRLVHGESDGLPGLVVDWYAGFLVVQFHTLGMERLRPSVVDTLCQVVRPRGVYERSDVGTRRADGLHDRPTGPVAGEEPPPLIEFQEHGVRLCVDVRRGQKTGFFLDQRLNRRLLQTYANGKSVLDCFSYTGGFSAHALKGGARHTLDVDIGREIMSTGAENLSAVNRHQGARVSQLVANIFPFLDDLADKGPRFDIVVLDPPSLVRRSREVKNATGVYIKLNRNAMKLVNDGGILLTSSCSTRISPEDFFQIVRRSAAGARVHTRVLAFNLHPPDHPVDLAFPEGRYLKCICTRVFR
jgi:23S rRNA (cytosine1962-C5)-methyltransferase